MFFAIKVRPAVSHWQRRDWEEEAVVRVGDAGGRVHADGGGFVVGVS